jgi:hypothetical protein
MEENMEIQKPLILEIDEAKKELIMAINNAIQVHRLPLYIVDMMLTEIGTQIRDGAKSELAMAKAQVKKDEEVA